MAIGTHGNNNMSVLFFMRNGDLNSGPYSCTAHALNQGSISLAPPPFSEFIITTSDFFLTGVKLKDFPGFESPTPLVFDWATSSINTILIAPSWGKERAFRRDES